MGCRGPGGEAQGDGCVAGSQSRGICSSGADGSQWEDGGAEPLSHARSTRTRSRSVAISTGPQAVRPVSVTAADVYNLSDLERWSAATAGVVPPLRLAVCGDPVAHSASPPMHN